MVQHLQVPTLITLFLLALSGQVASQSEVGFYAYANSTMAEEDFFAFGAEIGGGRLLRGAQSERQLSVPWCTACSQCKNKCSGWPWTQCLYESSTLDCTNCRFGPGSCPSRRLDDEVDDQHFQQQQQQQDQDAAIHNFKERELTLADGCADKDVIKAKLDKAAKKIKNKKGTSPVFQVQCVLDYGSKDDDKEAKKQAKDDEKEAKKQEKEAEKQEKGKR